jgi:hypothetical protein
MEGLCWTLPPVYTGQSLILLNDSDRILCFIWCIEQRLDLPILPPEIIWKIWKNVLRPPIWYTSSILKYWATDEICIEWEDWD